MLGACVGFWAAPDRPAMHSHIAGVTSAARGRDLGFALKLHQRAWALRCGVPVINWTFDPLIARNAHFNLRKLGGRPVKYAVNYYGEMPDAINAGDETDRMLLRWELGSAEARAACDGVPAPRAVDGGRPCWSKCRRTSRVSGVPIPNRRLRGVRRSATGCCRCSNAVT